MNDSSAIRVLIADDSVFIRHYLTELFRTDPDIAVVGVASDGEEVVRLANELHPDVVTMDYHMPKRTGLEAAAAIMLGAHPLPGIVMLSAFEGEEGREVHRTLFASGARVVRKPSGEVSLDIEKVAANILSEVKAAGAVSRQFRLATPSPSSATSTSETHGVPSHGPTLVVVIGASTGGPPLIEHLLTSLDPSLGISVVIVQHMSKYFTELFAERLDRVTGFSVHEAKSGDALRPGLALVVPGGMSLCCRKEDSSSERDSLFRVLPTDVYHEEMIDKTMISLASCFGTRVIGVLLSGMGDDGVEGLRQIKEHGGVTIAQEPDSATISSMPMSAINSGVVDESLPLPAIASYVHARIIGG
jgi:two-component system, chemotaxis family, protein-glutamate methylesterase/glutaminase